MDEEPAPFRILCLDGGGMRGVFSAALIAGVEEVLDGRLADHLDLIVGTSTGGLIALGLASGRTGQDMLALYRDHGKEIFSGSWPGRRWLRPKYSRKGLDRVLQEQFGDSLMRDLSVPTCVSAYEVVSGQTRVFKTKHAPDLYWGHEQPVWKVAAATSAAPTYFAPVQFKEEDAHVDGGIWANNPSMIAITEAVRRFDRTLDDIRLLSVGTVTPRARVRSFAVARKLGLAGWAKPALALLQSGPALGNHFQAMHLLGDGRYLRLGDRAEDATPIRLDDVEACQPLAAVGHSAALDNWPKIKALLSLPEGDQSLSGKA